MNRPYSSAVCSRRLVSRQEASRRGAVVDADLGVGVADLDGEQHRRHPTSPATTRRRAAVRVGDDQRAVGVEVDRDAADAVRP